MASVRLPHKILIVISGMLLSSSSFVISIGAKFSSHPGEHGCYVFSLAVDGFNPFHMKEAKQTVTSTGIYMVLLNFPPHLHFLPENMLLVGVIPGPNKPSLDEINHSLRPLVKNSIRVLEPWGPFQPDSKVQEWPLGPSDSHSFGL